MKNKLFILVLIFIFAGCSSTSKKRENNSANTGTKSKTYDIGKAGLSYIAVREERIAEIGKKYNISPFDIMSVNDIDKERVEAGDKLFIPYIYSDEEFTLPLGEGVKLEVSSPYGMRNHPVNGKFKFHSGIDLRMPLNSPIVAAKDGEVVMSSYYGDYGNCIIVEHENGYKTLYGHLNSRKVSSGEKVREGEIIGYAGRTGNSTGVHLHFEIIENGNYKNPVFYVKELKMNIVADMLDLVLKKEKK